MSVLVLGFRLSRPTLAASWQCGVARLLGVLGFQYARGELWAWHGQGMQAGEGRVVVAGKVAVAVVGRR